jgi:polyhydroxybutyrate depolymerase
MKRLVCAAVGIALAAIVACASAPPKPGPGTVEMSLTSGGVERTFLVHLPGAASAPAEGMALVLVFHGRFGTAAGVESQTGFSGIADREGFVAVYPQGEGRRWADGRQGEDFEDIDFVCAILDTLQALYRFDPDRVFATGMSNGAFFCSYLAENRTDLLLAIAPVAGGLASPWPGGFAPAGSISVLMINGTDDPLVPWEGGEVGYERSRRDQGCMYPVEQAFGLWAEASGCTAPQDSVGLSDTDPSDGCICTRIAWQPGDSGARVELIRVEGGGHTWPGLEDTLGERLVGLTCMDFVSPEIIWGFFSEAMTPGGTGADRDPGTGRPPHY